MKSLYSILVILFLNTPFALAQLNDSAYRAGQVITIPRVLYDMNKATLRPESYDSLDIVVSFLKKHDSLVVEIQNHTDTRISDHYCYKYSHARAQACADYIISKGIAKERIVPKGYGEKMPIIRGDQVQKLKTPEEKEAAHQKNRRTVLKVLRTDYRAP